jgi:hypothetical protein
MSCCRRSAPVKSGGGRLPYRAHLQSLREVARRKGHAHDVYFGRLLRQMIYQLGEKDHFPDVAHSEMKRSLQGPLALTKAAGSKKQDGPYPEHGRGGCSCRP